MKPAAQTVSFRSEHSIGSFFCLVFVYFYLTLVHFNRFENNVKMFVRFFTNIYMESGNRCGSAGP